MMNGNVSGKGVFRLMICITISVLLAGAAAQAGNIDPEGDGSRYAWGENIGWIDLEPGQGPGVSVTGTLVTGYAWSENAGWIRMDPAYGGVVNDGSGNLSGYAWGENVGWISFSCENGDACAAASYGVAVDPYDGTFSGYAWGENVGWISFYADGDASFQVATAWRLDTDGDGLSDSDEQNIYHTNPLSADSDGDGLSDRDEIETFLTNPLDDDSDGDGLSDSFEVENGMDPLVASGPCIPVLVAPESGETDVSLSATMAVAYADGADPDSHSATRWQIGLDEGFGALAMEIVSEDHLLTLTVPDLVLDGESNYFWRVRFEAEDGLERSWSETGRFTTLSDDRGDADGDLLPDNQEPGDGETAEITVDAESGWQNDLYILSLTDDDGESFQAALRLADDGAALLFCRHMDSDEASDAPPEALDQGLFGIKIALPEGVSATAVRLYLSPSPLAEESATYKYDTVNGWLDYSGFVQVSDDLAYLTLELVDGGYGDADGVANGVIVDPFGTVSDTGDDTGDDFDIFSLISRNTGDGCFIGNARPGERGASVLFVSLLLLAAGLSGSEYLKSRLFS